jgi:phage terminase large subunit-like protein
MPLCVRDVRAHDGNRALARYLGNLVGKMDRLANLHPTKSGSDQKIDAVVALMMGIGRATTEEPSSGLDGFLSRPLIA